MAYNITIDDTSPIISYSPLTAWVSDPVADAAIDSYFQKSYHSTSVAGATASFKFNGTGIWVFGTLRKDHGIFSITVDDRPPQRITGFSDGTRFKQLLVGGALANGEHTVVLRNEDDGNSFDLDFVTVEVPIKSGGATFDDADPTLKYSPKWTPTNARAALYQKGTVHETDQQGESVTLDFKGEMVQVLGAMDAGHGSYSVNLDGNPVTLNGQSTDFHPGATLFLGTGLGPGDHQMVITNIGTGQAKLDIDAILVNGGDGAVPMQGASGLVTPNATAGQSTNSKSGTPTAVVIGAAAGAAVLVILLLLGCFWYRRRRQRAVGGSAPGPDMATAGGGYGAQPRSSISSVATRVDLEAGAYTHLDKKKNRTSSIYVPSREPVLTGLGPMPTAPERMTNEVLRNGSAGYGGYRGGGGEAAGYGPRRPDRNSFTLSPPTPTPPRRVL